MYCFIRTMCVTGCHGHVIMDAMECSILFQLSYLLDTYLLPRITCFYPRILTVGVCAATESMCVGLLSSGWSDEAATYADALVTPKERTQTNRGNDTDHCFVAQAIQQGGNCMLSETWMGGEAGATVISLGYHPFYIRHTLCFHNPSKRHEMKCEVKVVLVHT